MNMLTDCRKEIVEQVKNIKHAQEKQKEYYDHRRANPSLYTIGTKVLKKDFLRRKRLTDKHIDAAQELLKKQFPRVQGLQCTLLSQSQTFEIQTGDFAQILNTGGHWVAISKDW